MEEKFGEFVKLCKKSIVHDPWASVRTIPEYTKELLDEAEELKKAVENNDRDNFREELGDVMCDWIHLCLLAEKQGLFTMKDVLTDIDDKIKRRKPYLLEDKKVTHDKAIEIWNNVKALEKIDKKNKKIVKIDKNRGVIIIDSSCKAVKNIKSKSKSIIKVEGSKAIINKDNKETSKALVKVDKSRGLVKAKGNTVIDIKQDKLKDKLKIKKNKK